MKTALLIALVAIGSIAQARVVRAVSTDLTCRQAVNLLNHEGVVIFYTGVGEYDRYVRGGGHCLAHEQAVSAWIPTKDSASCNVGFVCRPGDDE